MSPKFKLPATITTNNNDNTSFEGAVVLEPTPGIYIDEPIVVLDYASLYPSSMISENISHDSKVWTKEYDLDGELSGY